MVTLNNVAATIQSLTILRVRLPSTGTVVNTGAGGTAGTATTATEKIETGITLEVTPQVSSDGFVLLDMFAKSSQADFSRTVDNIPTEITRQATSHVLVRDGQTVVLGGIYRDTATDNTTGVPWFKTIPVIGWLFQNESKAEAARGSARLPHPTRVEDGGDRPPCPPRPSCGRIADAGDVRRSRNG